ncbi:hypothetical protein NQU96_21885 [Pseudoalteromonas elyakovii]|nr:hypothetical protein [Pseudoalteromonas elyakovii]
MASTEKAAELMLETGEFYTAQSLGKALSISANKASALLYNIRTTNKYKTVDTGVPNRTVKVVSIYGRKPSMRSLQNQALLFARPPMLANE